MEYIRTCRPDPVENVASEENSVHMGQVTDGGLAKQGSHGMGYHRSRAPSLNRALHTSEELGIPDPVCHMTEEGHTRGHQSAAGRL